jgi:putative endonuclease
LKANVIPRAGGESRKKMKNYYTYIMASQRNGTLYVGVTSDLIKRVWQHKQEVVEGFTEKYSVHRLVHYEIFDDPKNAIRREKRLKKWNRDWKLNLIERNNPGWVDLYDEISGLDSPPARGMTMER